MDTSHLKIMPELDLQKPTVLSHFVFQTNSDLKFSRHCNYLATSVMPGCSHASFTATQGWSYHLVSGQVEMKVHSYRCKCELKLSS